MTQTFISNSTCQPDNVDPVTRDDDIKARLIRVNRGGNIVTEYFIDDEKRAPNSCLICNHYKQNENNRKPVSMGGQNGKFVHICLVRAPEFIDITEEISQSLNRHCIEHFSRRAIL